MRRLLSLLGACFTLTIPRGVEPSSALSNDITHAPMLPRPRVMTVGLRSGNGNAGNRKKIKGRSRKAKLKARLRRRRKK